MSSHCKPFSFSILALAASIILYYSCKKIDQTISIRSKDDITTRFFRTTPQTHPLVKAIAENIEGQDRKSSLVKALISYAGFPRWDKAEVRGSNITPERSFRTSGINSIVTIPFAKDSLNSISALLIAWITDRDTTFKMIYHWQYVDYDFTPRSDSLWDARDVFNAFAYFEETVFNNTRFIINDTNLHKPPTGYKGIVLTRGRTTSDARLMYVEECTSYQACYYANPVGDGGQGNGGFVRTLSASQPKWCLDYEVCTSYFYESGGGFSGGGGGSGPTGGGGGNEWYANPCRTMQGQNPCQSGNGASGWTPIPIHFPPLDEPIDSLLKKYAIAVNNISDSLMAISLINPKKEYSAIIVIKNGIIYTKNIRTDSDSNFVTPNYSLAPGEVLLGVFHTHARQAVLDRSAPSNGDILSLKLIQNFVSYIECGNIRYALVVEDVSKATNFLRRQTFQGMAQQIYDTALHQPTWPSNWQNATQIAIKTLLGSAATNGIGFYISNNIDKTAFTKLNP